MIKFACKNSDYNQQLINHIASTKQIVDTYKSMLRIRRIEEAIEARYHQDHMKSPIHLCIGQEAVSVGVCALLNKSDQVFTSHRTHGPYFAKGGSLNAMLCELHCRINGCCASRGGSMHLIDHDVGLIGGSAIVAGSIPTATGAALSASILKKDRVVVSFFGDAATEEGVCWESLNFAVLRKLPIIYICENNYYSVCTPINERQPNLPIVDKAKSFGLYTLTADGNHVLDVYQKMQMALDYVSTNQGPAFIEAHTYRWRGHHGAGDDTASGYRQTDEVNHWQQQDPINQLIQPMLNANMITKQEISDIEKTIANEIEQAFDFAMQSPNPTQADLLTHVYSE